MVESKIVQADIEREEDRKGFISILTSCVITEMIMLELSRVATAVINVQGMLMTEFSFLESLVAGQRAIVVIIFSVGAFLNVITMFTLAGVLVLYVMP